MLSARFFSLILRFSVNAQRRNFVSCFKRLVPFAVVYVISGDIDHLCIDKLARFGYILASRYIYFCAGLSVCFCSVDCSICGAMNDNVRIVFYYKVARRLFVCDVEIVYIGALAFKSFSIQLLYKVMPQLTVYTGNEHLYSKVGITVFKHRTCGILYGQNRILESPFHSYRRIAILNSSVMLLAIKIVDFILHHYVIRKGCKSVREPSGNKKLLFIFGTEFNRNVLQISIAALSYIYRNVEYRALRAPDELCLRARIVLEMQSSQNTFLRGKALVVLHKVIIQIVGMKYAFVVRFHKPASVVAVSNRLDDFHSSELRINYFHC